MAKQSNKDRHIDALKHDESRKNIPTSELQGIVPPEIKQVKILKYPRNAELDPQLVWRGKDLQDEQDLAVPAPPLYIQEKVQPKTIIDDLRRETLVRKAGKTEETQPGETFDLFDSGTFDTDQFNGLPSEEARTEFYQHDAHWSNRFILGDSLQVMASLAEREGLRGKVQCIYFDPPYGIKFNSNFQWSATSRDVKDGKAEHITRQPEQVKAFRDTWRDGIHSYLSYLRDRMTVARDLLTDSGSIFVQIGDENVHRVRALMDEVFGEENFVSMIIYTKTSGFTTSRLPNTGDYILWYAKSIKLMKYNQLYSPKGSEETGFGQYKLITKVSRINDVHIHSHGMTTLGRLADLTSQGSSSTEQNFTFNNNLYKPSSSLHWKTHIIGLNRLDKATRIVLVGKAPQYLRLFNDYPVLKINSIWGDTGTGGFTEDKVYVVQTNTKVIQRCILMATDPGDLVLDPTCGSGTTPYVAEQWGRRWIGIDTSRVALTLSRARLMGARYPWYLLADSPEGQQKEAEISRQPQGQSSPTGSKLRYSIRMGFVYERVPHITLKSIANNTEIDIIWDQFQPELERIRQQLNEQLNHPADKAWQEWEIPREAQSSWPPQAQRDHADWWRLRIERQRQMDACIAARAEYEYLYDKPYEDKMRVRVAGPFTVESISPYRMLHVGPDGESIDPLEAVSQVDEGTDFGQRVLSVLKQAGVQQAHKEDRIKFESLEPWPGQYISAEGRYTDGTGNSVRAGIFIGPEFNTVSRQQLVVAAREAAEAGFEVMICCAFNYEASTNELQKLGSLQLLKARMNADLFMGDELKNTGSGNLFVVFGEPDIELEALGEQQWRVRLRGVDVFHPQTGKVHSDAPDAIPCWFVDTDYNNESFFVRQAYFPGTSNDPYDSLKRTLKAEIDAEAWASLQQDVSRPFATPSTGQIAVKVINHLGDEVLKVLRVPDDANKG